MKKKLDNITKIWYEDGAFWKSRKTIHGKSMDYLHNKIIPKGKIVVLIKYKCHLFEESAIVLYNNQLIFLDDFSSGEDFILEI